MRFTTSEIPTQWFEQIPWPLVQSTEQFVPAYGFEVQLVCLNIQYLTYFPNPLPPQVKEMLQCY